MGVFFVCKSSLRREVEVMSVCQNCKHDNYYCKVSFTKPSNRWVTCSSYEEDNYVEDNEMRNLQPKNQLQYLRNGNPVLEMLAKQLRV